MSDQTDTPSSAPPTVSLGDWVKVVNVGEKPFTAQWDSRKYTAPVGGEVFMPFEAAKLWLGDPRAAESISSHRDITGMVSWIPDRATEVRRLRALYDNQFGDERTITGHPVVEVYTQAGDRIYTVLDDPNGERVAPAVSSVMDHAALLDQVKRQQATIDLLLQNAGLGAAQVEDSQSTTTTPPTDSDVQVEDDPPLTTTLPSSTTVSDSTPRADDAGA